MVDVVPVVFCFVSADIVVLSLVVVVTVLAINAVPRNLPSKFGKNQVSNS